MDTEIINAITEGAGAMALATIIQVKGSAPRHPGSTMLLNSGLDLVGTIGGGRGEAVALDACKACLFERRAALVQVEMTGYAATGQEMVCGGINTMLVECITDTAPYRAVREILAKGKRALLAKRIRPWPAEGTLSVDVALLDENGDLLIGEAMGIDPRSAAKVMEEGKPVFMEAEGLFLDPLLPEEKLLILGGGHVGLALASFAVHADFNVTVVDDRPEFLAPGRFPANVHTLLGGFVDTIAGFPVDPATYVVILTRGHLLDLECIRAVLQRDYRYAGFIGSRRKTRLLLDQALQDGFPAHKVEALYAPIGLDIGAETPEELAISILGELIAVRRNATTLNAMNQARKARRA